MDEHKHSLNYLILALITLINLSLVLYLIIKKKRHKKKLLNLTINKIKPVYRLDKDEEERLTKGLQNYMSKESPYLDKDLTLSKISIALSTNNKKMSILFNHHLGTNFYDFINEYRVQAIVNFFVQNEDDKYSILGLAYRCGFKNKGSFYRAFKKFKKCTPGEYISKLNIANKV